MKRYQIVLCLLFSLVLAAVTSFWTPLRSATSKPTQTSRSVAAQLLPALTVPESAAATQTILAPSLPAHRLFDTAEKHWMRPIAEEPFARFHDWANAYLAATEDNRTQLEKEGFDLARTRRAALKELIRSDPQRALELTVPAQIRASLPDGIQQQLEERIAGRGRLAVLGAVPEPGHEQEQVPTFRTATIGQRHFEAFVYGRRLGEPTRFQVPLYGIAIDQFLAVDENPLRILEPSEAALVAANDPICAVSGQSATAFDQTIIAEIAGQAVFLCQTNHAIQLNDELTDAETGGPTPSADDPEPSAWTEGQKSLILIRVDFPDLPGQPFADTTGVTLISNLNVFYTEMSYGRAGFFPNGAGSDYTPTFRMPQPAAYYGTNNYYDQLRADARSAAAAAGYAMANYNRDVICMGSVPGWSWSGLGYVGAAGSWLRNSFGTGVAAHELGHNWGLNHANYWDTAGQSVIGAGTSIEYGDSFDTMGSASAGNNHFNARYKNYLNWLTSSEVITATSNGTYRIYAHDNPNSTGIRGLRIVKDSSTNYWVEFRQKFTSNKWLMNGAGLRWGHNSNQKSHLLDTTPGSADGKNDACIVLGRTFSDRYTGIHITPVRKGGTSPESLDVVVNLGLFPANQLPVATLGASATSAATGVALNFTTTATDPDGDTLAYYWEFGDGSLGTNAPTFTKSWATAGEYVVRCVVSDMKGGVASDSVIVTIGSPTTYRISGQITSAGGPVQGVRTYVSTTRMAYTDSDGTYTIVGLPAGSYTVNARLENYTFTSAFINPVTVGPNASGIDFVGASSGSIPPNIVSQPASQAVGPGASVTFSVSASGSSPLRYQWRFNGAGISGATLSSYTRTNVQSGDAGNYSVVVSNNVGSVTSANAMLTLNTPPSISLGPQNQTVLAGSNALFTVTAGGSTPLGYQWRFNNTNLPGATLATLTRSNVQLADAGPYRVVVTNSIGSVTSAPATLTVHFSLAANVGYGGAVTKNPDQPSYAANSVVTLTASPVSIYEFTGWSGDAAGSNNPLTVVMTSNKTITANFASPVPDLIVDNPYAVFSGSWTLESTAGGLYGPDYQIAATTGGGSASATATFVPNIVTPGRYNVYAWFPAVLKGASDVPYTIASSDGTTAGTVDESAASGGWLLLAADLHFGPGTNGFVRIANNTGQGGKNIVADAMRWAFSEVQVGLAPVITMQCTNQAVMAGAVANFSVSTAGTTPMACQWRLNGTPIVGATNDTVTIWNAQPANAGTYTFVVTNIAGAATSAPVTLRVSVRPTWTAHANPFTISGTMGDLYRIEFSTNLVHWTDGPTLTNTGGSVSFVDADSSNYSRRFYRCRVLLQ